MRKLNLDTWREEYRRKLVNAEEAVRAVRSGDRVFITFARDPTLLCRTLAQRAPELKDVRIEMMVAQTDPGWLAPERQNAFSVTIDVFCGPMGRGWLDAGRCDFIPQSFSMFTKIEERLEEARPLDVLMTVVSPPNERGYCSFGYAMWTKKRMAQSARTVIAEVDNNLIRTYGDNFIHVSEIDYFVENTQPIASEADLTAVLSTVPDAVRRQRMHNILMAVDPVRRLDYLRYLDGLPDEEMAKAEDRLGAGMPTGEEKSIAGYIATLIRDGDTLQVGTGSPSARLAELGAFDGRYDLGIHSEIGFKHLARLMKTGVITGRLKTLHPGKVVMNGIGGASDELDFFHENRAFELYGVDYTNNPKIIALNDNMVAINNALSIDLAGQVNAETTFGTRIINGPGGQPDFAIGVALSRGGRNITCLLSTALDGAVSRIVPALEPGSPVTVTRNYVDYVVTEYGIARLMGKNLRERANELIAIAHPDFRETLRQEAREMSNP